MNEEYKPISFGAIESMKDPRTLMANDMVAPTIVSSKGKVALDYPTVDDLCNQRKIGICTMCGVRMATENEWKDGIRLDEYWGYLMGKTIYDDILYGSHFEGSSALTMLKVAHRYGIPEKEFCEAYPLKIDGTYDEFIDGFQSKYGGKIPQAILDNATLHKISGYYYVPPSPETVAKEIQKGKVVIARFAVGANTYTKPDGSYTRKAKHLLPLRPPAPATGGHIWDLNQYWAFGTEMGGPNSWSRSWCDDNEKQEAGYFWFNFETQKPYFTEAFAIMGKNDKYIFKNTMKVGATGADVVALQKVLVDEGLLTMPTGVSYGFFGEITKRAVIAYQEKYADAILKPVGLTKGTGFVGPSTIAHLNNR